MQMVSRTSKHSQLGDVSTPHVAGDMTEAYIKVSETTVSGGAVTSVQFTGLDLESDETYLIYVLLKNATASASTISMTVNSDATATNYYAQTMIRSDTTAAGNRTNDAQIGYMNASDFYHGHLFVHKLAGVNPWANYVSCYNATATVNVWNGAWVHNSTTNVTTLTIIGSTASSIADGSKIIIYKLG